MFIHDLGVAYRAAARKAPFLDAVNFHPYPNPNPSSGADAPSVGCAGRTRAFRTSTACSRRGGTRSTGPANRSSRRTANFAAYSGSENTSTVSEDTQARFYSEIIGRYSCDPRVSTLLFFHWIDESDRDRLQTGLVRADGTFKP